jgi:hypothetical protein
MTRRLPLILVAVVAALCVVGVSVAAVASGGSSLAYSVNGHQVSQRTINSQLGDLASSKAATGASKTEGSMMSQVSAQVLTVNIVRDVLRQEVERRGKTVTDAARKQAKSQVASSLAGYPDSYVELAVDVQAYQDVLGLTDDTALNTFLLRQFRQADIVLNPRYGTWHARTGVCPPTGCSSLSNGG